MKILHTSDWHVGRTLHGVDLHDHHEAFVDQLVDIVQEHDVRALLISGDVYDRAIPAVESVRLFGQALRRLSDLTTVVITPGNHDSASRLGFGADVMRDSVRIIASVDQLATPVIVDGVAIYGIPYLDPDAARPMLARDGELPERSHTGVVTSAMDAIRSDLAARPGHRSVVMAHAFVIGAEPSDSERDISIGGVQSVSSTVFDGVDYVALGHLHGPQNVPVPGSDTVARYCGSPLAFSFSERHHTKSVALVDLGEAVPQVDLLPLDVPRKLTELDGALHELLSEATDEYVDDWLKVTVTDAHLPADVQAQLRAKFAHLLQLKHQPELAPHSIAPVVSEQMSPAQVTSDFVEFVSNSQVTKAESKVIDEAYRAARAAEVGA